MVVVCHLVFLERSRFSAEDLLVWMSPTGQLSSTGQMSRSLCLIRNLCKRLASHVLGDGTRLGEGKEGRKGTAGEESTKAVLSNYIWIPQLK